MQILDLNGDVLMELAPGEFIVRGEAPGKIREAVEKVWREFHKFICFSVQV